MSPPGPRKKPELNAQSVREALRQIRPTLRLVLDADAVPAIGIALFGALSGVLPIAIAWVGKLIVDGVLDAMKTGTPEARELVLMYVALEAGLMVLTGGLSRGTRLMRSLLGIKLGHAINIRILEKALALDLKHFENPALYDKMQNARREASSRPLNVFTNFASLGKDGLTLLSIGVALITFSPFAVLALIAATIPSFIAETKFSREAFKLFSWRAPEGRRLKYYEWILTRDREAKEVRLYDLGETILERYRQLYRKFFGEDRSLAVRRATYGFLLGLLSTFAFYGCYAWIVWRTVGGAFSLGEMTFYLAIFRQGQNALRSILGAIGSSYEDNLFMSNLFAYLDFEKKEEVKLMPESVEPEPFLGFSLEDVSFSYPGTRKFVFEKLNLKIGQTEKLAIVGENGAGKTTLIKLLTGLYEPNAGRVLLDGIPVRDYPEDKLRARFAVVLQDFVQYQFTAMDNIGLGWIPKLDDVEAVNEAAKLGGADSVIKGLPDGLDTQLGRWFEGGTELSMGQWQKLAISRAFMRNADILILDEPTAALDAEAEFALFERFRALADGKMAFLISHRFSTVRMADRIVVLSEGKIRESGSHDELIAADGRYAQLYGLQAKGYLEGWT